MLNFDELLIGLYSSYVEAVKIVMSRIIAPSIYVLPSVLVGGILYWCQKEMLLFEVAAARQPLGQIHR